MPANDLMTRALLYRGSFESDCNFATPLVCVQAEFSTAKNKKMPRLILHQTFSVASWLNQKLFLFNLKGLPGRTQPAVS